MDKLLAWDCRNGRRMCFRGHSGKHSRVHRGLGPVDAYFLARNGLSQLFELGSNEVSLNTVEIFGEISMAGAVRYAILPTPEPP